VFKKHWTKLAVAFCIVFACSLFILLRLSGCGADDAYIHRRITEHLIAFGHPWYNTNDRVMSTSAPLWNLVLAVFMISWPAFDSIPFISAFAIAAASVSAFILVLRGSEGRGHTRFRTAINCMIAVIAVFSTLLPTAVDQMETPFGIALALFGLVFLEDAPACGLTLMVLSGFVRYELFGYVFLAIGYLAVSRRIRFKIFLAPLCALAIGFGWLEESFHTLIPNTIKAKRIGYSVPYRPLAHAILSSDHDLGLCALFLSAVIVGIIFFKTRAGAHEFCRKNATGIFLLVYALAAWCVYFAGDTMIFGWYRPIVVLPLVLGTILCLIVDGSLLNALPASILTALLCVPAYGYVAAAVLSKPDSIPGYVDAARVHTYLRVGDAIWKVCPNGTLMTSELGGLGQSFHGYIYDGFGLTNPDALRYHPLKIPEERSSGIIGAIPWRYVMDKSPDLIVSYDIYAKGPLNSPVLNNYKDEAFPTFAPPDSSAHLASNFGDRKLHVMVRIGGRCDALSVDESVARAYE
jgi:hypothetical protein